MYRSSYEDWHHVYHMNRLSGPVYLQPIFDEQQGQGIDTTDALNWIELWKVAVTSGIATKDRTITITE